MRNLRNLEKPQPEPVKTANFADSEPDLLALQTAAWQQPVRRRFGSSGRIAAPPMMNAITPTSVPTGRADFASMALRDAAAVAMNAAAGRWRAQQAQRAGAGHQQHTDVRIQI